MFLVSPGNVANWGGLFLTVVTRFFDIRVSEIDLYKFPDLDFSGLYVSKFRSVKTRLHDVLFSTFQWLGLKHLEARTVYFWISECRYYSFWISISEWFNYLVACCGCICYVTLLLVPFKITFVKSPFNCDMFSGTCLNYLLRYMFQVTLTVNFTF